ETAWVARGAREEIGSDRRGRKLEEHRQVVDEGFDLGAVPVPLECERDDRIGCKGERAGTPAVRRLTPRSRYGTASLPGPRESGSGIPAVSGSETPRRTLEQSCVRLGVRDTRFYPKPGEPPRGRESLRGRAV